MSSCTERDSGKARGRAGTKRDEDGKGGDDTDGIVLVRGAACQRRERQPNRDGGAYLLLLCSSSVFLCDSSRRWWFSSFFRGGMRNAANSLLWAIGAPGGAERARVV